MLRASESHFLGCILLVLFFIILVIYSFDVCVFLNFPQMLKSSSQMNKMQLLNRFSEANKVSIAAVRAKKANVWPKL